MNGYDEPRQTVEKLVREKDLKQKVLLGGGKTAWDLYAVTGYPTSFLIDPAGNIVSRDVGFTPAMASSREEKLRGCLPKDH